MLFIREVWLGRDNKTMWLRLGKVQSLGLKTWVKFFLGGHG